MTVSDRFWAKVLVDPTTGCYERPNGRECLTCIQNRNRKVSA